MRVLVTGGAGFIGHHLVRALVDERYDVTVIDDLSTGNTERSESIAPRIRFVRGSIVDPAALDEAMAGCNAVLHHAAIASVARSVEDPATTNQVNVDGTIEVMLAAARAAVGRVIVASSAAVYGNPASLPCTESMRPEPLSPYATSKLAAEHYVHALGRLHGIDTVAFRYFNVFGPAQDPASDYAGVVSRFISASLERQTPIIHGDGATSRDFVYIDDVVAANLRAIARPGIGGLTCNIATGQRHSLLELLEAIAAATGSPMNAAFGPERSGDVRHSQADISLAREVLGFAARVPFAEGIARTVQWYRDGGSDPALAPGPSKNR